MALIRINPTKMLVGGNQQAARDFLGPARSQLEILKQFMSFQNLSQGIRRVWLNEDVYVECRKIFHYQECRIWVRPAAVVLKEEVLISFILIISSQSEQEAFAWDISTNAILTDEIGDPMTVDTLDNVKDFVTEYIKRTEAENYEDVLSVNDLSLVQLEISDSYYESWWRMDLDETPECANYSGYVDIEEWNNNPLVWPDYYQVDYTKKTLADCVNEQNQKISKIHHPVYYEGVTVGHDPDFDIPSYTSPSLSLSQTNPNTTDGLGPKVPIYEWMTPYIEYTNHETEKEEEQQSSGIIKKYGQYYSASVPDEIKAGRCGLIEPEDDSLGYVRTFYWFASIFGINIKTYEHPTLGEVNIVASQSDLDAYTDILYNTWSEDCHAKIVDNQCLTTTWAFSDFGLAENKNGAVVFDYCTIAWGYDSDDLTEDQKYRGAVSGEYSQIFRLYSHPVGSLIGYALAMFEAHNDIRVREDLEKFSANKHLTEAAQRHANDLAANGMTGHIGSDGSSYENRINDTDYFLWVVDYTWIGENANNVDVSEDDVVATAMLEFENSPLHYANMISEDFDEVGVGVAYGIYAGVPFIWFVVNFGSIENKWPGFAQVDTTDILTYMNDNFLWSGTEDHIRVPKLFLV